MRQIASNIEIYKVVYLLANVVQYCALKKKRLGVSVYSPMILVECEEKVILKSGLLAKTFISIERLVI